MCKETASADEFCRGYIDFLNAAKTEREAVREALRLAEAADFLPYKYGTRLKAGDRVSFNQRGKALTLFIQGRRPLADGVSIVACHLDSPRLDLKMKPLYEAEGMAYFDTHYYGGIKAYQWVGIPLALHGTIVRKDGSSVSVRVGEDAGDPVLFIADLLPHLGAAQMARPGSEVVRAEDLDVLAGLRSSLDGDREGAVKRNIVRILREQFDVCEADLVSAELSVVPAFHARDLGLDRSMVGAYGQDDKVCAYTALAALLSLEKPEFSAVLLLADKEETGSLGVSGMQSAFFYNIVADLASSDGVEARHVLAKSRCLSGDVIAAIDPLYPEAFDQRGDARLNHGVALFRYWGSKGKENTNDASAEMVAEVRRLFDEADILWQTAEGGKVDAGESGTLSRFIAALDVPTLDVGVPLLSMHSPFEASAKTDVYMAHRAFKMFFSRIL
jgi:aspartyl aminopeptidase